MRFGIGILLGYGISTAFYGFKPIEVEKEKLDKNGEVLDDTSL